MILLKWIYAILYNLKDIYEDYKYAAKDWLSKTFSWKQKQASLEISSGSIHILKGVKKVYFKKAMFFFLYIRDWASVYPIKLLKLLALKFKEEI